MLLSHGTPGSACSNSRYEDSLALKKLKIYRFFSFVSDDYWRFVIKHKPNAACCSIKSKEGEEWKKMKATCVSKRSQLNKRVTMEGNVYNA